MKGEKQAMGAVTMIVEGHKLLWWGYEGTSHLIGQRRSRSTWSKRTSTGRGTE